MRLATHAVAPFRLLTLFRIEARVAEEATRLRSQIERALDRVGDRREWVIRIAAVAHTQSAERAAFGERHGVSDGARVGAGGDIVATPWREE